MKVALIIFVGLMALIVCFARWGVHNYGLAFVLVVAAIVLPVYAAIDRSSDEKE